MNAFLEIQRRRLDMEAEKQARMLEMEAEKQDKMLEIEVANAKTKAKDVALASMMTGVKIMMVDINTVSPRKRSWFEKMQANMLKFDEELSMAASAIFFGCRQVCWHDHGGHDGMVELKSHPFVCWHVCRPASERHLLAWCRHETWPLA
ncbi:Protein UXT-like protein [Hordeum vulgare]|nr:Protein UXT-like protein [Hordeum vulgare]